MKGFDKMVAFSFHLNTWYKECGGKSGGGGTAIGGCTRMMREKKWKRGVSKSGVGTERAVREKCGNLRVT